MEKFKDGFYFAIIRYDSVFELVRLVTPEGATSPNIYRSGFQDELCISELLWLADAPIQYLERGSKEWMPGDSWSIGDNNFIRINGRASKELCGR